MAKYDEWISEEGLIKIEGWARDGLTDKQIAHNIGVAERTIYDWKKKYPQLSQALKKGKEVVDRQVENALLKSALGFSYIEETVTNAGDIVQTKKYSKPNTTAQIFWLKNRKPADWRDKQIVEQTNKNITVEVGDWDDE
ncbi:helix-turn-helix domain-containing protein [Dolosigranulum pigrum]|uniref:helix-turn-helix domain-containing protein n=1 Tax=Dolosigranulum pigrum TaxID=29394 RepID=UPI001AD86274|nr:helix-turn-helix domain-containing protein [Dolosigranulum pigrum]QTJ50484.1 helix-turn-helix domain-containing protein [Dolosigranulum pigrum]